MNSERGWQLVSMTIKAQMKQRLKTNDSNRQLGDSRPGTVGGG